ncbi:MAG: hypothetical protein ABEJ56_02560 [Candidatus Nanohaloarchaea archaeon]
MVYEKKCAECGQLIDFGGEDDGRLPEKAIEFDGEIYCKECVKNFVEFGTGALSDRVEQLEEEMDRIKDELGLEKH